MCLFVISLGTNGVSRAFAAGNPSSGDNPKTAFGQDTPSCENSLNTFCSKWFEPSLWQGWFCSRRDFRRDRSGCVNDGKAKGNHRARLVKKRKWQRGDRQQRQNAERRLPDDSRRDKSGACEDGSALDQFGDIE